MESQIVRWSNEWKVRAFSDGQMNGKSTLCADGQMNGKYQIRFRCCILPQMQFVAST